MTVKADGVDLSATTAANVGQAGSNGGTYTVIFTNRGTSAVTASSAKSSSTIVPFTIFADVTVLSPGVISEVPLTSKFVGR